MSSILKELPELVANDVITSQTAKDIEKYYVSRKQAQGGANTLAIFGSIGAVLVGLGIILIFAHNWDNFSKSVKTLLAFLPLIASQVFAGYCLLKNKSSVWKEAAGTLLFFSVGASIALVAQIYNIQGDLSGFLFTWTLLCLPLMYLFKANTPAFLYLCFCTYYAVETGYFNPHRPWPYLFFIAAFVPYYLNVVKLLPDGRVTRLFHLLFPLSLIIALGSFMNGVGEFGFLIYIALLGLIYNTGMLPKMEARNDYRALGMMGIVFILIITSFKSVWDDVENEALPLAYYIIFWAVLFGGALYMAILSGGKTFYRNIFQAVTVIFPLVYILGMFSSFIATVATNMLVLVLGIFCIREGINRTDFRNLNFGLLTIAVLIICRFFDTKMSFAVRGLLFVAVGVGFFVANYILIKRKRTETINMTHHES